MDPLAQPIPTKPLENPIVASVPPMLPAVGSLVMPLLNLSPEARTASPPITQFLQKYGGLNSHAPGLGRSSSVVDSTDLEDLQRVTRLTPQDLHRSLSFGQSPLSQMSLQQGHNWIKRTSSGHVLGRQTLSRSSTGTTLVSGTSCEQPSSGLLTTPGKPKLPKSSGVKEESNRETSILSSILYEL